MATAMQLSWDLHVHPGPSSVPRWGTGEDIQAAAARAGVEGFVWKSHDMHTAVLCNALAKSGPVAIGSASTNEWATPDSIADAVREGARWVWGATHSAGRVAWDQPLHRHWPAIADAISASAERLVLATGHLGPEGRRAFAELASTNDRLKCSVTHSLYLETEEVTVLRTLGCVFEVDLFTATRSIAGRPAISLAHGIRRLRDLGADVYLTTDCGQVEIGDPYVFSGRTLGELESELGAGAIEEIGRRAPAAMAAHVLKGTSR